MIDAKKLEEAVKAASKIANPKGCNQAVIYAADLRTLIDAAEAHLATLPRTKEVTTWHVEFALWRGDLDCWHPSTNTYQDEASARRSADVLTELGARCVRVTGPHKQTVPA